MIFFCLLLSFFALFFFSCGIPSICTHIIDISFALKSESGCVIARCACRVHNQYFGAVQWSGIMLFKSHILSNVLLFVILINSIVLQNATHLSGTFRTGEFFKLLAKFGFQKTERHSQRDSYGYIYGNITSKEQFPVPIALALLDKYDFLPLYGNRSFVNRDLACQKMFATVDHFAYDRHCSPTNPLDFLRHVPCTRNKMCIDETSTPTNVIPGHQFTYVISNLNQPR